MDMKVEELNKKYGFPASVDVLKERRDKGVSLLDPIYLKHLPAAWIIQTIWGHVQNGNISSGKARELTTAVIEEHLNDPNLKHL